MEEFPSNSHRIVEKPAPEQEPKKVEKVVEGEVVRRKKPFRQKLSEMFVGDDAQTVGQYVFFEVLLPAVKDTIVDVTSQGVERLFYGEVRTSNRRGPRPNSSNYTNYTSYSRYQTQAERRPQRDRKELSKRARATHDFDQIILKTRGEAQEVIDRLFDLVNRYDAATVADLYDLVGIGSDYTDDRYGWTDLRGAGATRLSRGQGYLLDLPQTELLER
jgi:hypothetical protein